jgi:cysteine synthase
VTALSDFQAVMGRRYEIMARALRIDYRRFEFNPVAFDYEGLMAQCPYTVDEAVRIQRELKVGGTPLIELPNITRLVRSVSPPGKGARIFIKDEANNPSGSFKARRASLVVRCAKEMGYEGVIAATSGNYGAAVASQAAMQGLKAIILQEAYDSQNRGQPEILEKGRACGAYGAEVWQLTVGPELFYLHLKLLEETGFFNASLYVPHAIVGIETLGYEIGLECLARFGRPPDAVVITHAGGGNVTGTARGLRKAGCTSTQIIGASVDLRGLHMASDRDFNRKCFTTGHTGFGVPFLVNPDRVDVPRNCARALRYLDRYVVVTQGEVFYMTEVLAQLEGLERGPAGNTSLAAAFAIAQEMDSDAIVVVQETEYTGAGKHPTAQLTFARSMGIEVRRGNPDEEVPGVNIVIPEGPDQIKARDLDLQQIKRSYVRNALARLGMPPDSLTLRFLAEDMKLSPAEAETLVAQVLDEMGKASVSR